MAARFSKDGEPFEGMTVNQKWTGWVDLIESKLDEPLHARKPRTIFVNSMSDTFHERVPDEWLDRMFAVMALCPQHRFIVLTKRARRMREYVNALAEGRVDDVYDVATDMAHADIRNTGFLMDAADSLYDNWPLPSLILGVSCEDQERADERIPELLATPAACRMVSLEPLLGAADLSRWFSIRRVTTPQIWERNGSHNLLDWVIVGGESGPGARPCNVAWARSIVRQCRAFNVACFVKQLGAAPEQGLENAPLRMMGLGLKDKKGGDITEWPTDLRVREMPEGWS